MTMLSGLNMYQALNDGGAGWVNGLCGSPNDIVSNNNNDRTAEAAADQPANSDANKGLIWGPTHSLDSEDESVKSAKNGGKGGWTWFGPTRHSKNVVNNNTQQQQTGSMSTPPPPQQQGDAVVQTSRSPSTPGTESTKSSNDSPQAAAPPNESSTTPQQLVYSIYSALQCQEDTTTLQEVCNCAPKGSAVANCVNEPTLGICQLEGPRAWGASAPRSTTNQYSHNNPSSTASVASETRTAAERRRQRHKAKQQNSSSGGAYSVSDKSSLKSSLPVESVRLTTEAQEMERQISELTMRSSYGQATAKLAENRRMAYYAVGRHHRQSGKGGNRRCYFTGKLILGGAPFYAGSVQQGLRTLVVFCLPSALDLPRGGGGTSRASRGSSVLASLQDSTSGTSLGKGSRDMIGGSMRSGISRKGSQVSLSRLSSLDDMSLSVEEELDPNWGLDKDYLLKVLPPPSTSLLNDMERRYPAQYETLPVQVRVASCWRLYVKFCFFSGLPIAEGELHYQVREEIVDHDEIILSHEVMEAVNGDASASLLRLPNMQTFRYLQKHYQHQCNKLPENVFQRSAWELVLPEV